ncbi:hypothetical protein ASD48_22415 [Streptomyces sp. Root1310]|nr:hypothetical protein ASD48_22415 [Streptomyces sp. Root1310]
MPFSVLCPAAFSMAFSVAFSVVVSMAFSEAFLRGLAFFRHSRHLCLRDTFNVRGEEGFIGIHF